MTDLFVDNGGRRSRVYYRDRDNDLNDAGSIRIGGKDYSVNEATQQ